MIRTEVLFGSLHHKVHILAGFLHILGGFGVVEGSKLLEALLVTIQNILAVDERLLVASTGLTFLAVGGHAGSMRVAELVVVRKRRTHFLALDVWAVKVTREHFAPLFVLRTWSQKAGRFAVRSSVATETLWGSCSQSKSQTSVDISSGRVAIQSQWRVKANLLFLGRSSTRGASLPGIRHRSHIRSQTLG